MKTYNLIHAALNEEISSMIKKVEQQEDIQNRIFYDDSGIVIPSRVSSGDVAIHPISNGKTLEDPDDDYYAYTGSFEISCVNFHNYITKEYPIKKIEGVSVFHAIKILEKAVKEAKGKFYGAIMVFDKYKLNILHPLVVPTLLKEVPFPDKVTLLIYQYGNFQDDFGMKIDTSTSELYQDMLKDVIPKIWTSRIPVSISFTVQDNPEEIIRKFSIEQAGEIRVNERSTNSEQAIIPVHLCSTSVFAPWYSMVSSTFRDGHYESRQLFPVFTGNVYSTRVGIQGTTCTGNEPNNMFSSLHVLSNMNINSMYNSKLFGEDFMSFVDACQEVSIEMLNAYAEEWR